jgi:hypothetical protein
LHESHAVIAYFRFLVAMQSAASLNGLEGKQYSFVKRDWVSARIQNQSVIRFDFLRHKKSLLGVIAPFAIDVLA